MKIQTIPFCQIKFTYTAYEDNLKASLQRMGLGFPIKIKRLEDESYRCVDGNKRMSAIQDILKEDIASTFTNIQVLVLNDARTSSGTTMNHH